ncbi:MAG TPA: hypothetical protein VKA03_04390 [Methylovirgula sp.]|nr:hypothetical protein [Methylovirgula sp.]
MLSDALSPHVGIAPEPLLCSSGNATRRFRLFFSGHAYGRRGRLRSTLSAEPAISR